MFLARHVPPTRKLPKWLVCATLLAFVSSAAWVAAAAAPVSPGFPSYLAKHQADLEPFFEQRGCDMLKDGLPILVSVAGNILLITALFGWLLDVPLAWGFSTIFAPAYAKITRALVYASGRLILALLMTVILSFAALVGINAGAGLPALVIVAVLTIPAVVVQVFWISHLYRTPPGASVLFYFALLLSHALIAAILMPTMFSKQMDTAITQFMDQSVMPCLRTEADREHHETAGLTAKRDATQARVTELESRIAQDHADEQALEKAIEERKNAPAVVFSHLVFLHAQGNLADAGKGFADFIAKYANDPHADAARGQLEAVNQALSAQQALERQQQADLARTNARAKAQLLAQAAAGQATLSEIRHALLGKTRAEVISYFGTPSETGANRWGYGRRMVLDPQTHEARGLTVVFSEGFVQGVDYYYGEAK